MSKVRGNYQRTLYPGEKKIWENTKKVLCDGQGKPLEAVIETPMMKNSKEKTFTWSACHVASTLQMKLDPSEMKKAYLGVGNELISCKAVICRMGDELIELLCRFFDTKSATQQVLP